MRKRKTGLILIVILWFWVGNVFGQSKDILSAEFFIQLDTNELSVSGKAVYTVKILKNTDTLRFDADDVLHLKSIKINGKKISFEHKNGSVIIRHGFKAGKKAGLVFEWEGKPRRAMYFTGWKTGGRKQIWTQGQGKKNSGWMPVVDHLNDKFSWIMHVRFPSSYRVISNGKLVKRETKNGMTERTFVQDKPASSYLIFLGVGHYESLKKQTGKNLVPVESYFYPGDSAFLATYHDFSGAFRFLEEYLETPYPWPVYRQLPIRDFFYGGMENLTATTLNERYYTDSLSVNDTDPFNVTVHELAHQWFGNLVTEKASRDHWLHESFATFLAREAEKNLYGRDYYDYENFREKEKIIKAFIRGDTVPLQNGKASSLTFYQKGAWILRMMRDRLGEEKFRRVLKTFLKQYAYKNASTEDFQKVLFEVTGDSIPDFFGRWFRSAKIPVFKIKTEGEKIIVEGEPDMSIPVRVYFRNGSSKDFTVKGNQVLNVKGATGFILDPENRFLYKTDWTFRGNWLNVFRKEKNWMALYQLTEKIPADTVVKHFRFFKDVLAWDYFYPLHELIVIKLKDAPDTLKMQAAKVLLRKKNINQRRLAIMLFDKIPADLKSYYESLLNDPSYVTKGLVLQQLIFSFPGDRAGYLDITKNITGGSDKAFRMLWLVLALNTGGYLNRQEEVQALKELTGYASPEYPYQVRMEAFFWIDRLGLYSPDVEQWLKQAAGYFNPALARLAKELLKKYGKEKEGK